MSKRLFIALLLLTATVAGGFAQGFKRVDTTPEPDPETDFIYKSYTLALGPKVGLNYSLPAGNGADMIGLGGGVGFEGALAVNLRFGRPAGRSIGTERFGLNVEAQYGMRSMTSDGDNVKLNCVTMPVLFQWYMAPSFALELGPTFSAVMSASPDVVMGTNNAVGIGELKSKDVMATVGATLRLRNGLTGSLRYNYGTSDLADNFPAKVSTLSLNIGWLFTVIK